MDQVLGRAAAMDDGDADDGAVEREVARLFAEAGLAPGYRVTDFENDVAALLALVAVEQRFGVAFADHEIGPDLFARPQAMAGAIRRKTEAGRVVR